jgi:hypothetical protein
VLAVLAPEGLDVVGQVGLENTTRLGGSLSDAAL